MNRYLWSVFTCVLLLVLGCSKAAEAPVDTNEAERVLQAALEAWKQGENYDTLQQKQPPLYFNEREWETGKKLENFHLGPVSLTGRQGRCTVKLSLRDKAGKLVDRDVTYLIDTVPQTVIVREMMGP